MQLLISLCISLQFYLQFLQFLLPIPLWGHTVEFIFPLRFVHSTCGIFGYTFLVFFRLARESILKTRGVSLARERTEKMWLKLIQMINQINAADYWSERYVKGAFGNEIKCPPAISIIRGTRRRILLRYERAFAIVIDRARLLFLILQN